MTQPITFFVPGKPQPAGSKRAFAIKKGGVYTGRTSVVDANKNAGGWKDDVRAAAMPMRPPVPLTCPLKIKVIFFMPRIKDHYRTGSHRDVLKLNAPNHHVVKPDATKLLRGLEDALTGIMWKDDSQIAQQSVLKIYGDTIGAQIEISELLP